MTTTVASLPDAPHTHYQRLPPHLLHPPSSFVLPSMQNHPPLRQRLSASTIQRVPPMPPSLMDSPFVQNPNSPFRRDHSVAPSAPNYSTGHDRLNLLDTVPISSTGASRGSGGSSQTEPTPDDIGVAGAPKTARSSSMRTPMRPGQPRGNSWYLQQQAAAGGQSGATSPTQSASKLQPSHTLGSSNLPLSTPYPPPNPPTKT